MNSKMHFHPIGLLNIIKVFFISFEQLKSKTVLVSLVTSLLCAQQLAAQVTYHLGNSLTDTNNDMLLNITLSAGKTHTYLRTTIPGAPTDWIWDHPGNANGEPDYRTVFSIRTIDHIFTQPFAGHCRDLNNETDFGGKFFTEARKNNANVQHWLYMQWPDIFVDDCWSKGEGGVNGSRAMNWIQAVCNHRIYFEKLRDSTEKYQPGKTIRIMPSGLALAKLKIEMEEGRVPGLTNFYSNTFSDDLHLNDKGSYLVSLTHYVGIYGESPVGKVTYKPTSLTEQQANIYKQIAWDVVSDYPFSGLGGSGILATEICNTTDTDPPPLPPSSASGNVEREYWENVPGTAVADIPVNTQPTGMELINSLEGPTNSADNYGTRIRGYIVPFTEGWYDLYIAGDDNAELWFSSGPNPADKRKVAFVSGSTSSKEWTKSPNQKSSPVYLVSGGKFYFEILHKESSGGDNVAVAWTGPSITSPSIISGVNLDKYIPIDNNKIRLEAESSDLSAGAQIASNHGGYSGTGFVDGYWTQGAAITFAYNAPSTGDFNVTLGYANGSGSAKNLSVYVNDVKTLQTELIHLDSWSTWGEKMEILTLNAGDNSIAYRYDADDAGNVNLDFIDISSINSVVAVEDDNQEVSLLEGNVNVYPNPAENLLHVKLYSEKQQQVQIRVMDYTGILRFSQDEKLTKGTNNLLIDTSTLLNGLYLLHVITDQKRAWIKVKIAR